MVYSIFYPRAITLPLFSPKRYCNSALYYTTCAFFFCESSLLRTNHSTHKGLLRSVLLEETNKLTTHPGPRTRRVKSGKHTRARGAFRKKIKAREKVGWGLPFRMCTRTLVIPCKHLWVAAGGPGRRGCSSRDGCSCGVRGAAPGVLFYHFNGA